MRTYIVLAFVCFALLSGCDQVPPKPESSSGFTYAVGSTIPVDNSVYTITGQVVGEVESLVRQTAPAQGRVVGYGSGYISGSFYGPELNGKGLVRLFVHSSDAKMAPSETVVVLKMEDTKGIVLLPGDVVTVKCRAQFEALSATTAGEPFSEDAGTWELDFCRMATPSIRVK